METITSKVITPYAGFVVKGFSEEGKKYFVNVCFSGDIGPAESSDNGQVRVPMSIGDLTDDIDKKKQVCQCVDVIVNEGCVSRAEEDPEFKKSFVDFILGGIESKHKVRIGNVRALKLGYKGEFVKPQRIRVDKANLVKEIQCTCDFSVDPPDFTFHYMDESTGTRIDVLELPQYVSPSVALRENLQSFLGTSLRGKCQAKRHQNVDFKIYRKAVIVIANAEAMRLKVSSRRLTVLSSRLSVSASFSIWFPVRMDPDSAKAEIEKSGNLTVSIIVKKI